MLIDFTFSNYRSFRDSQSFSMKRDTRFADSDFGNYSTVTAIYGANASGKSNFLRALFRMCDMVRTSYSQGEASTTIPRDPFALQEDPSAANSTFFAEFIAHDNLKYRYWFEFNDAIIVQEKLSVYKVLGNRPSTHASLLFFRHEGTIDFGASFRGPRAQLKKTVEVRPNALVLSAAAAAGISCTQSAFDFFTKTISYCSGPAFAGEQPFILYQFDQKNKFAEHLSQLIHYADFGISNMQSKPAHIDKRAMEQFKQELSERLGADTEKLESLFSAQQQTELQFEHTGAGSKASFGMENESQGTLAALSFFSIALKMLSAQPMVTLVDEIDSSLHPTLVRELVALYTDPATNPHKSQLIFTTHDTSLINVSSTTERLMDPDQIWLVEKSNAGASEIYPVTDLNVRREENIGKNYLNGVYGATPNPAFHAIFARIIEEESKDE